VKSKKELVPSYIRHLEIYQAGKPIEELAREKNLSRISKLGSNENPLGPSPLALKELNTGLKSLHRYPDMHGYQLKSELSKLFKLKKENIILGNGSEGIMACIVRAFLAPDEEVLTSERTFIGFMVLARSVGAKLKTIPLSADFKYDIPRLVENITEKTKIIYIANPNNPTGTYISKQEFDYFMSKVPEHILVILDEAYFEFVHTQKDYPDSMDYRYDNVITLRTFSKAYGLSGIRIGYGFAHEDLITNIAKVKLPFEPNSLAQLAALGALHDADHLAVTLQNNQDRYQETIHLLTQMGIGFIPSVANFITFDMKSAENAKRLHEHLLNCGVIVRPLDKNEMPEFLRVSLGTKEEMQHFSEALRTGLIKKF